MPHEFKATYFKKPTWCDYCGKFIKGVTQKQGMTCQYCDYNIHFACLEAAIQDSECTGKSGSDGHGNSSNSSNSHNNYSHNHKRQSPASIERQLAVLKDIIQKEIDSNGQDTENHKYIEKIYDKIDPNRSYSEICQKNYHLEPQTVFKLPAGFRSVKDHEENFDRSSDPKTNKNCKNERILSVYNLPEILQTEYSYNLKLGNIFHYWLIPLAYLTIIRKDIPEDFLSVIFQKFPNLYWSQIDRWRNLMKDLTNLSTYSLSSDRQITVDNICHSFLPHQDFNKTPSERSYDHDMACYIYHCKLMENDSYNKWITDFENHSTNVYNKIKQYGSEIIKENAEKHNTTTEKPMALKAALVEPFQRITRYPLLLDTCLKTVKKVVQTNSGYIREKDILERALAVVKRFTESVNDDVRKEEERTLYNKISYNMEIVLGKNPDKVIALLDKPNLRFGVCAGFADYCYNSKFF